MLRNFVLLFIFGFLILQESSADYIRVTGTEGSPYKMTCEDLIGRKTVFEGKAPQDHQFFSRRPIANCLVEKELASVLRINFLPNVNFDGLNQYSRPKDNSGATFEILNGTLKERIKINNVFNDGQGNLRPIDSDKFLDSAPKKAK